MRKLPGALLLYLLFTGHMAMAQTTFVVNDSATATTPAKIDRLRFFTDDKPVDITIATDFKNMHSEKVKGTYQGATITLHLPDSDTITEDIRLYARGEFRRKYCSTPGIMLNFKNNTSPKLSGLKKLKLVSACSASMPDERLLLEEYLVYKMYNLLTDMSFKVRLARVTYKDSRSRAKEYSQYAFLIEDIDDMASRNHCKAVKDRRFLTEQTNRSQMTLMALFQYMIGNTDWAVPNGHNIKFLVPVTDTLAQPYVVPYDFDYAGLINAYYAAPAEGLPIERVTERYYMGFPRTLAELQQILQVFRDQKENMYKLINDYDYISKKDRDIILKFVDEFYDAISSKSRVQYLFMDGARRS